MQEILEHPREVSTSGSSGMLISLASIVVPMAKSFSLDNMQIKKVDCLVFG